MQNDIGSNLAEIRVSQPQSIVNSLIQVQQCSAEGGRDFAYFNSLRCLSVFKGWTSTSRRSELSFVELPRHDDRFAAVSHVWRARYEGQAVTQYRIRLGSGKTRATAISDIALDRIIRYIKSRGVSCFWMDQECIDQRDKQNKEDAIQSMDIVYRRSCHPVGLLSTSLTRQRHVNHLHQLLEGLFAEEVGTAPNRLQLSASFSKARRVLRTLRKVVCDPWWTRRWTFQEEYCTTPSMHLLIPLRPGVNKPNISDNDVEDFIIDARVFRQQATRFCIACLEVNVFPPRRSREQCLFVLRRVKSYRVLRKYGWQIDDPGRNLTMSARILADLCCRCADKPSDTLAIMANCCGYSRRLKVERLKAVGVRSLSLAILALFVLNGEIVRYDSKPRTGTVLEFLKDYSFQGFDPPVDCQQLTFMKRCRLSGVRLCHAGVQTTGYLWRCHRVIKVTDTARHDHSDRRAIIDQIVDCLNSLGIRHLGRCLENYRNGILPDFLSTHGLRSIFEDMVQSIVQAVIDTRPLILAQLDTKLEASAIFVSRRHLKTGSIVFTSFEPAEDVFVQSRHRFLDKFVSFRVDRDDSMEGDIPQLKVRDWVNGIWLPESSSPQQVAFAWPRLFHGESMEAAQCG